MRSRLAVMGMAFCFAAGSAAFAGDERLCSGVDDQAETSQLKLGRVTGKGARVNFISSPGDTEKSKDCPADKTECRRRAFVTSGDVVLVEKLTGGYACVSYVSQRAVETGGWLPAPALELTAAPDTPKPGDWTGQWKRVEAAIKLRVSGDSIVAQGDATYGASDPGRVQRGAVNIGEFSGSSRPRGNMLAFGGGYDGAKPPGDKDATDCQVRLRLFGRYILAEDNRMCGGHNVSFSGVYVRAAK